MATIKMPGKYIMLLRRSIKRVVGKQHRYNNPSDLKDLTPEQIVRLDPDLVYTSIYEDADTKKQLSLQQQNALRRLYIIKQNMRKYPLLNREKAITNFLDREGLRDNKSHLSEVDSLIVETTTDMMKEKLQMNDLHNRLNRLDNKPIVPDTEEESLFRRSQSLFRRSKKSGGKKTRAKRSKHTKRNKKHIDKNA
jgi:hypothetical protein